MPYLEHLVNAMPENLFKGVKLMSPAQRLVLLSNVLSKESRQLASKQDPLLFLAFFLDEYCRGIAQCYKIANGFGYHLDKTNLDIPMSLIPWEKTRAYMLEFPESVDFGAIGGALISVLKTEEVYVLTITLLEKKDPIPKDSFLVSLRHNSVEAKLEEVLDRGLYQAKGDVVGAPIEVFRRVVTYCVKCLLYIESGEPDLQREVPQVTNTKKPKKIARALKEVAFPLVRVGYGFHDHTYHVGETQVCGHFRWQPYGPGRTLVKLIWIDEHARVYKKQEPV